MTVFLSKESIEQCPLTETPLINLVEKGGVVSSTNCGHKFSKSAITNWMAFSQQCPVESCGKDMGTLVPVMLATNDVANKFISSQSDETCLITSTPLAQLAKEKKLVAIDCGHKFDRIGILNWMGISKKCPVEGCKADIKKITPVNLISNESTSQRPLKRSKTENSADVSTTSQTSSSSTTATSKVQDIQPLVDAFNTCFDSNRSIVESTLATLKAMLQTQATIKDVILNSITTIGIFSNKLKSIKKDYDKFDKSSSSSKSLDVLIDTCENQQLQAIKNLKNDITSTFDGFKKSGGYNALNAGPTRDSFAILQKCVDSFLNNVKLNADKFNIVLLVYKNERQD